MDIRSPAKKNEVEQILWHEHNEVAGLRRERGQYYLTKIMFFFHKLTFFAHTGYSRRLSTCPIEPFANSANRRHRARSLGSLQLSPCWITIGHGHYSVFWMSFENVVGGRNDPCDKRAFIRQIIFNFSCVVVSSVGCGIHVDNDSTKNGVVGMSWVRPNWVSRNFKFSIVYLIGSTHHCIYTEKSKIDINCSAKRWQQNYRYPFSVAKFVFF